MYDRRGGNSSDDFGFAVDGGCDVNGDCFDDFLVGAPGPGFSGGSGSTVVFSAADG